MAGNNRKNTRSRSSGGRGGSGMGVVALVLVALAIFGGAYWYFKGSPSQSPSGTAGDEKPTIEAKNVDYRKVTRKLQDEIEITLKEFKGQLDRKEDDEKEADRSGGGKIRWNNRNWELKLPEGVSPESVVQKLQEKHQKEKRIEISSSDIQPGGKRVVFHLIDQLGGEPLRIKYVEVLVFPSSKVASQPVAGAKIAIVIDDFGYSDRLISQFASYPHQLTFAILPNQPFTSKAAQAAQGSGKQHILHLPMEAIGNAGEEKQTIHVGDGQDKIDQMIRNGLAQMPGVAGVNNHQGSKATSDGETMKKVMSRIKKEGLVFLDSRTSGGSKAESTARSYGISTGSNQLFLDGEADVGYIKNKIRQAVELARKNGTMIVIGHDRPATLQALKEMEPIFREMGVQVVPITELLQK